MTDWDAAAEKLERHTIPEPNSGCLLWCGPVVRFGHGILKLNKRERVYAHRASWALKNGPIPPGISILHKCDVPCCVEPNHLFAGTQADNMADMAMKGRSTQGERHPNSRINEKDAREIAVALGSYREIGIRFGITKSNVSLIKKRKAWKHLWGDE